MLKTKIYKDGKQISSCTGLEMFPVTGCKQMCGYILEDGKF